MAAEIYTRMHLRRLAGGKCKRAERSSRVKYARNDKFNIKYFGKKGRKEGRKERERIRRRAIYIFRREQRKDRCPF
jgi:hypothetical protein